MFYRNWYFAMKDKMGDRWSDDGYIFINLDTGKRIGPEVLHNWLNKITHAAGLGHWTVHSMRHTNITMKLRNNVPILEVSGQAGHTMTSTTMNIYGHFLKTDNARTPEILDNIMAGNCASDNFPTYRDFDVSRNRAINMPLQLAK